ncbi:CesT family type III secretion system chaperone [Candidatus Palauibacter sp.]|uniref:CesT family type III secretion system chaperone n=1 Tax=Candidatus Palauibacter sp. TaxID=3101350 RepID=UPI003B515DCC
MLNREDIESFLIRTEAEFEELDEGLWIVQPNGEHAQRQPRLVVNYQPPVLVCRADIRDLPIDDEDQLALYRKLLELNAVDLIHGAYGLEDGEVILSDTLELENLDFSEFRATLESLTLALTTHWDSLTTEIPND